MHLGRGAGDGLDDTLDAALEVVSHAVHGLLFLFPGDSLHILLLDTHPLHLNGILLEHLDGPGHIAEFVLALGVGDLDGGVAGG